MLLYTAFVTIYRYNTCKVEKWKNWYKIEKFFKSYKLNIGLLKIEKYTFKMLLIIISINRRLRLRILAGSPSPAPTEISRKNSSIIGSPPPEIIWTPEPQNNRHYYYYVHYNILSLCTCVCVWLLHSVYVCGCNYYQLLLLHFATLL